MLLKGYKVFMNKFWRAVKQKKKKNESIETKEPTAHPSPPSPPHTPKQLSAREWVMSIAFERLGENSSYFHLI